MTNVEARSKPPRVPIPYPCPERRQSLDIGNALARAIDKLGLNPSTVGVSLRAQSTSDNPNACELLVATGEIEHQIFYRGLNEIYHNRTHALSDAEIKESVRAFIDHETT